MKKKPTTAKAGTLQSSLRQLSKVAELLSRNASIGPDEMAVLESAITEVRKYAAPVADAPKSAKVK